MSDSLYESDERFMRRALLLAGFGLGSVAPNPLVGCVIVHNDTIIGEGWHRQYGKAHAEVNAVNSVREPELLPRSTMYVTLEPCCHHGKTGPCTELIILHKIPRVVIAAADPFAQVNGQGIEKLRAAGVQVQVGMLKDEAEFLNRRFVIANKLQRPYIILKWAQSQDGFIEPLRNHGQTGSIPVSGSRARQLVHRWRTEEAAFLVGARTAINDNPRLSARYWPGKQPARVVIDPNLSIPPGSHLLDNTQPTYIFNRMQSRVVFNTTYIQLDFNSNILPQVAMYLHHEGIRSLVVEGGAITLNHFINNGLWDEARIFTSRKSFLDGLPAPQLSAPGYSGVCGDDTLQFLFNPLTVSLPENQPILM